MIDFNTLVTPLDPDVLFQQWLDALDAEGLPTDTWQKGGPIRTLMRIVAMSLVAMWNTMIQAISGGFLETSSGDWLTLLAYYVYGVTRTPATKATGPLTLTNTGGGQYGPFAPGALQATNPGTNQSYVNTTPVTINPGQTLTGVVFIAQVAGSIGTSAANTITSLGTPLENVTVTNPADIAGLDAQDDDDLKAECMAFLGTLSMLGVRGAYAYAVDVANDNGNPVDVNRKSITPTSSTGTVGVIVASPSGTVTDDDLTAIGASIEAIARPDTVTVNLASATVVESAQTITVWARTTAGLDADALTTLAQDAVTETVEDYDIGGLAKPPSSQGYLFASDLEGAVKDTHAAIFAVDGFTDIPLDAGQVAEVDLTVTVRFVQSQAA